MTLAILRSFSAVPAHAVFEFLWVIFMKYAFIKKGQFIVCFVVPLYVLLLQFHFASSNFIVSLGLVLVSWVIALRMFSIKENSKKEEREYEKKFEFIRYYL